MTAVPKPDFVSEEDYLAGEVVSEVKHEYLAGVVVAMAGASNRHSKIAVNVLGSFFVGLRGKPCEPFNTDTKVRTHNAIGVNYYYPDAQVVCDPNAEGDSFQERPKVIVEVLSESTRHIDTREKAFAYTSLPSLDVYILIEQDVARATVYRRGPDLFVEENYEGLDAVIPLSEVDTELALAEVYEALSFE